MLAEAPVTLIINPLPGSNARIFLIRSSVLFELLLYLLTTFIIVNFLVVVVSNNFLIAFCLYFCGK